MNFEALRKVGADYWVDYLKTKKNVYKAGGIDYKDADIDIIDPKICIAGYTHKHDVVFGKCSKCAWFATDFMCTIITEKLGIDYIRMIPTQEIADLFTNHGNDILDNTKCRNKIFRKLVKEYVNHIECEHPELYVK